MCWRWNVVVIDVLAMNCVVVGVQVGIGAVICSDHTRVPGGSVCICAALHAPACPNTSSRPDGHP